MRAALEESTTEAPPRARRLPRSAVFGLLAVGGLLAVIAGTQPWWDARTAGGSVAFSGTEATGGLSQALAVVLLAGTLLGLTLQVVGRRILAVLLGLAAAGAAVLAAARHAPAPEQVTELVAERVRQTTLTDQFQLTVTGWPWAYLAGGMLALLGAVGLGWSAGAWPRRRARFDRTERAAARLAEVEDLGADPAATWQAQDLGLDPTAARTSSASASAADAPGADPDVHREPSRDTMGHETQPGR